MAMIPLHDYVLVEVEPPVPYHQMEGYTHIVIPEAYEHGPKDRPVLGRVLKCGPDCHEALTRQTRVVIEKWRGAYLNPTRTLLVVREPDILAVWT